MISIFISIFAKNVLSFSSVPLLLHPSTTSHSQLDPAHTSARLGLQSSEHSLLESVVQGLHLERRSLPPPAPDLRIAMLPQSTPMHRMR